MCGIIGAVWWDERLQIRPETFRRMVSVLRHRGPDEQGMLFLPQAEGSWWRMEGGECPNQQEMCFAYPSQTVHPLFPQQGHKDRAESADAASLVPGVALGACRLAIIDVAGGRQPMPNEDGTIWVVQNGEIYNFRTLRQQLLQQGHRFRTASDTEVIVHLYEQLGPACLQQLWGMFALAVWDSRQKQLLLARDRLGKKPLFYRQEPGRLLFASELKSLLELPGLERQVDPGAVDAYLLYQYVPPPQTILVGFSKLPPAGYLIYRQQQIEQGVYWQPDFQQEEDRPVSEYAAQLRELLTDAVRLRLQSEVPLGAFLSGGIDSTIVVGLMQKFSTEPVRTFTIGFPVLEYDETHYARIAAEALGTVHQEFRVEPDALRILPQLVWHFDEPMADSSALPTWYVAEQTRQHVTVALTGDGGDELFLGYPRYPAAGLAGWVDRLPGWLRSVSQWPLWQRLPRSGGRRNILRRLRRFLEAVRLPPDQRYIEWICIFNQARRLALYTEEFRQQLPPEGAERFLLDVFARAAGRDPITTAGLVDLVTYLPCDLMVKVDIASMAHSLECRQPFLDHRVVELAIRMPRRLKYRWGRSKWILRHTFADLLPPAIQRRGKMGFGVPVSEWFRGPLRGWIEQLLTDGRLLSRGYFRPESIQTLLAEHMTGRFDHGARLWALAILELWHRRWIDSQ
ncbi:MAG: asparagine synthase (glutamine-hydrolyzing) [Thermoguttaceae bacterium]|nr:asparagine synthase (glutamine-hydrolyzing) [Thermoguttaceae bacterium]MDW8038057.1 asparagine synthase (glutamine-hydrolyzing) [Thermoguttaceae bacterium]